MGIIGLTDKEDTLFTVSEATTRMYVTGDFFLRYVQSYNLSYSMKKVERSVYNSLMLLGDVGGLYGLLFSVFSILNAVFTFQKRENLLAQRLYRVSDKIDE